jgi:hypothetical protein
MQDEQDEADVSGFNTRGEVPLDMDAINIEIREGARAGEQLLRRANDSWNSWSILIRGFGAMRDLAFSRAGVSDIASHAYRREIGALLELKKNSVYAQLLTKQTRSSAYKLIDSLEQVDLWYAALPAEDRLRWKHPDSIVKHCPTNLLQGGRGHNQPKRKAAGAKKKYDPEIERLKALLLEVIRRLAAYEPAAVDLLSQVSVQGSADGPDPDLDDEVEDL